jgi:uncharacterized membrane protein YfhO
MMQNVAAVAASIIGGISTLSMLVLLMAGLANAKPAQVQQGKWMMWSLVLLQVVVLAVGIVLMVKHKPWPAAIVGISPLMVVIVLIVILVKIEW